MYRQDLAYIHDTGHADYAIKSAPGILALLAQQALRGGLIVDLGCGSGWSAQAFTQTGYPVLGVDQSEDLLAIARRRVPQATFHRASLYEYPIPTCQAVTSVGECLNYRSEQDFPPLGGSQQLLTSLFQRIFQALIPGGLFIFDIAEPGQLTTPGAVKTFTEGDDWLVLVEKAEDPVRAVLTRRIITLRRVNNTYRRDDEVHTLQLYPASTIAKQLEQSGFEVQLTTCYGDFVLPPAHSVLIAHKPT
ncbi:MAG: class I SAM-dependent methyltransferase [Leptolyngbyaceae cyanobacterium SM2_5_2]|nr:class I SAM-dependent methyltransferase [Leptolyngbyaceae cyanobacterium SM2_5_2]